MGTSSNARRFGQPIRAGRASAAGTDWLTLGSARAAANAASGSRAALHR
jgi:hypothetical protein